jgi:F-type H+-transporting ATPase subunit alpha
VRAFESNLYAFMDASHPEILKEIDEKMELSADLEANLRSALTEFKQAVPL